LLSCADAEPRPEVSYQALSFAAAR
jgi:hypothetical protein